MTGRAKNRDIVLREDEMRIGGRDRQLAAAKKMEHKLKEARTAAALGLDGGGQAALDAWCSRQVTASGNFVNRVGGNMVHGYGRKNPNANNFKHKR